MTGYWGVIALLATIAGFLSTILAYNIQMIILKLILLCYGHSMNISEVSTWWRRGPRIIIVPIDIVFGTIFAALTIQAVVTYFTSSL